MKNLIQFCVTIVGIAFAIICSVIFLMNFENEFTQYELEIMRNIVFIVSTLIALSVGVCGVVICIIIIKNGIQNVKKCSDDFWSSIDLYKRGSGEKNAYYLKQIEIINLYYREGGRVEKLVENKDIKRLFVRMDYLNVQTSIFDDMTTYFYSLAISVIASLICQMMECENLLLLYVQVALIMLSFFTIVLAKYVKRGQDGSYRYLVDKYEQNLLSQKIDMLYQKVEVKEEDEDYLKTKQIVIDALLEIKRKKKGKEEKKKIAKDIECVECLQLYLDEYSNYKKQEIYVKQEKCYLLYDAEKGRENNYIGELNLKTQDYAILYDTLKKYELISYK